MFNVRKDNLEIRNCVWFSSDDVFNEMASISHADIAFKLKLETFKDKYMYKILWNKNDVCTIENKAEHRSGKMTIEN
mgnify:FL=1